MSFSSFPKQSTPKAPLSRPVSSSHSISMAGLPPPHSRARGEGHAQHRGPGAGSRYPFHPTAVSDARTEECPKHCSSLSGRLLLRLLTKASYFHGCCFLWGAFSPAAALRHSTGAHTDYAPRPPYGHLTTGRGFSARGQLPPTAGASGAAHALRRLFPSGLAPAARSSAAAGPHREPRAPAVRPARSQGWRRRGPARSRKREGGAMLRSSVEVTPPARCRGTGRGGGGGSSTVCFATGSGGEARSSPLLGDAEETLPRVLAPRSGGAAGASGAGVLRGAMKWRRAAGETPARPRRPGDTNRPASARVRFAR